jgi:hypothetical protein
MNPIGTNDRNGRDDDMAQHDRFAKAAHVNHLRSLAATVVTVLPVAIVGWTAQSWRDRLPDPLPTHWSALSTPDGFTSYGGTWQVLIMVSAVGALLGVFGAALSWLNPLWQRATLGLGAAVGFGALGIWLATARAAWGRTDAHGAPLGWGVSLPVVLGIVAVVVVLAVVGRRPCTAHTLPPAGRTTSALVLAPGERAVWSHRTFVPWPLVIAVVMLVAALVLGFTADPVTGVVLAAAALAAGAFAWVQVTVDERGLRIGLGPWAWTVKKMPLEAIATATAESIEALDWGGWGYRVKPGRSALVLHSGPAIVLELTDGRRFAVTVDDPETPVALLDALRARAA